MGWEIRKFPLFVNFWMCHIR
uniref:Uncharacterized protein n=1 Tax=Arundo donax TaxID=35708 RepID=A0A0A9G1W2_ARUDO